MRSSGLEGTEVGSEGGPEATTEGTPTGLTTATSRLTSRTAGRSRGRLRRGAGRLTPHRTTTPVHPGHHHEHVHLLLLGQRPFTPPKDRRDTLM